MNQPHRDSTETLRRFFLWHIHPPRITTRALCATATFGLGIATLVLFMLLCGTGFVLMLYYVPTPQQALSSTADIEHAVAFGGLLRAAHRLAAHAMVLTLALHLLRIALTAAYVGRTVNWLLGLGLLISTLGLSFTGYLLPWDQLSFWAVSVSGGLADHVPLIGAAARRVLLGGSQVGGAALTRFYALHVAVLPAMTTALLALHLWRLRKDGGLARDPMAGPPQLIPSYPSLLRAEVAVACFVTAAVLGAALFLPAPLGGWPDPHAPSDPEKTPWYFLWLQEMVSHSAPVGGFVFPGLLFALLLSLPFVDRQVENVGQALGGPGVRRTALIAFAASCLGAAALLEALFVRPDVATWLAGQGPLTRDLCSPGSGLLALALLGGMSFGFAGRSRRAGLLAALLALVCGVLVFSLVAYLRGPGWVFYWPWQKWPHAG